MKSNKLGPYINELMMLAMETNHSITYDLAIKELKAISNKEGALMIQQMLDGILDSITKKLTGPQVKKIEEELATIVQLHQQIVDEWEKV